MNFLKQIFNKPKENIIFLHLPKAGGTTLRHIFNDQYNYLRQHQIYTVNRTKETSNFLKLSQKDRDKIKVLIGHFSFGLHDYLKGEFKYVTMLREPNERLISAYNYTRSLKDHDLHKLSATQSLADYFKTSNLGWLENGQTKFIAGVTDFNLACSEQIYDQAIKNIEHYFCAVGVLERFEESIENYALELNWSMPKYEIKNVTNQKKPKLTEEDIYTLSEKNRFDARLYDFINKRLTLELENRRK